MFSTVLSPYRPSLAALIAAAARDIATKMAALIVPLLAQWEDNVLAGANLWMKAIQRMIAAGALKSSDRPEQRPSGYG